MARVGMCKVIHSFTPKLPAKEMLHEKLAPANICVLVNHQRNQRVQIMYTVTLEINACGKELSLVGSGKTLNDATSSVCHLYNIKYLERKYGQDEVTLNLNLSFNDLVEHMGRWESEGEGTFTIIPRYDSIDE